MYIFPKIMNIWLKRWLCQKLVTLDFSRIKPIHFVQSWPIPLGVFLFTLCTSLDTSIRCYHNFGFLIKAFEWKVEFCRKCLGFLSNQPLQEFWPVLFVVSLEQVDPTFCFWVCDFTDDLLVSCESVLIKSWV